jgi:tetratricopeptide (TPR) repeat protein
MILRRSPSVVRERWVESHLVTGVVIVLLALAAYANSFGGAFVFDDLPWIVENDLVRDLRHFFLEWRGYRKQPNRYVGHLTLALNYRLGALEVTGYHVVNFSIHVLNALLVYALGVLVFVTPAVAGSRLSRWARPIAFSAAILFVTHPIQTQAVSYVVQRYTSLAATFYLATVVQYVAWRVRYGAPPGGLRSGLRYVGIFATMLLAMKTKESTFTLPIALVACEVFFFRPTRRSLLLLVPQFATLAVIPATKLSLGAPVDALVREVQRATVVESKLSRIDYLRTQLSVIVEYVRLVLYPAGQTVDHDHPVPHSFLEPRVLASAAAIGVLCAAAIYLFVRSSPGRRNALDASSRVASFGIVWFFLALSVESSLIPIADVMVEHRVYLPSVGLFLAVAVAAAAAVSRWFPARPAAVVRGGAVAVALVLAVLTFQRNRVWADGATLWSDAVAKAPGKARPHYNLGQALVASGDLAGAIRQYRLAIELDPRHVRAHNNLGVALQEAGRREEAVAVLERAIRLDPSHEEAYYNLGNVHLSSGVDHEQAVALFAAALRLRKNWPEAYANMAAALNSLARYESTIQLLDGAADVVRENPEAHFNLGVAHVALGHREAALGEIRILQRVGPALAARLATFMER